MGDCHAIGPVPVASPWTFWGGCGGIGRRAALRSLWANNPWKFESSQPHHFLCYHIRISLICKHLMCLQMCGDAQNDVHK